MLDWIDLDKFINSKAAINYVIAALGGLVSSLFIIYYRKYRGNLHTTPLKELLLLFILIPVELIAWSPFVVILALLLDNNPLFSLLVGLAHEQIWNALEKSFDKIALIIVKMVVGRLPDIVEGEKEKKLNPDKKIEGLSSSTEPLTESSKSNV
jgi:hypothetical protein